MLNFTHCVFTVISVLNKINDVKLLNSSVEDSSTQVPKEEVLNLLAKAQKYADRTQEEVRKACELFEQSSHCTSSRRQLVKLSWDILSQAYGVSLKLADFLNLSDMLHWFENGSNFLSCLYYVPKEKMQEALNYIAFILPDINQCDDSKRTALHYASFAGNVSIARFLLQLKANVNATDESGKSVLFCAVLAESVEMAQLLLEYKANVNATDENGNSALHCAIAKGNIEMAELLLKHNADVEAKNLWKHTALHYAVSSDNIELSRLLLTYQADPNIKTQYGRTALNLASTKEMANELRKAGGLYSWELAIWDFIKQIYRLIIQMPVQWTAQLVHRLYQGLAAVTQPTV